MPKKHSQPNKVRKRKAKDLDQINEDLQPEKAAKLSNQPLDLDLPGNGQFYCIECNRYFTDDLTLGKHRKTKGLHLICFFNTFFSPQAATETFEGCAVHPSRG
jgi:hypothetical protein